MQRWPLPDFVVKGALRYVEWVIGRRFDAIAPLGTAGRLNCPLLLVHGAADDTVPVSDAHAIALAHGSRVQLLEIPDAGHNSVDRIEAQAHALLAFLGEHGIAPAWAAGGAR